MIFINIITHFLTAYLFARALGYEERRFECFFIAIAGILPDVDSIINVFVPFEHGIFTHTYLGGLLFVFGYSLLMFLVMQNFMQFAKISFGRLFLMGFLGLTIHFLLDSFTFHYGPCSIWLNPSTMPDFCNCPSPECVSTDDRHHLYFWPVWNFPPHINTIFPYPWITFQFRVWVEVIFTAIISVFLLYLILIKKQNFFEMFNAQSWRAAINSTSPGIIQKIRTRENQISIIIIVIISSVLLLFAL